MSRRPARRAMRGQSMVEVAVAAAVLVPLLLLLPLLGKYVHTGQAVQQAARAAAWEATVAPEFALPAQAATRERLVDRFFADASAAVLTDPAPAPADAAVGNVLFNTWSGQPLLRRGDVALQAYGNDSATGALSTAAGLVSSLPLGWDTPNARGLVTAEVQVRPRNLVNSDGSPARHLAPFDDIDLVFDGRQALLADAWNAGGPHGHARAVRNQVTALVPTAALTSCDAAPEIVDGVRMPNLCPLAEFSKVLQMRIGGRYSVADVPIIGIPGRVQMGLIEPDVVPYDKAIP